MHPEYLGDHKSYPLEDSIRVRFNFFPKVFQHFLVFEVQVLNCLRELFFDIFFDVLFIFVFDQNFGARPCRHDNWKVTTRKADA
jgi:hypothetical protein